jgi:hypothetical protein
LPVTAAAQEASIRDFFGTWRGLDITISDGGAVPELAPGFLDVEIQASGNGFQIRWNALGRTDSKLELRDLDTSFVPTDRPGVYAFDAYQGSSLLGRLFASPATGNPLEGQILLWARIEGATLIVYGLSIDPNGHYDLHRHAWTLSGKEMSAQYIRRTEKPVVLTIEGRLERAGG